MKKTGVIIVLYNPDLEALSRTLDVLCPQADIICLVDNSTGSNIDALTPRDNVHYIPLGHNTGIAAAQNKGIAYLQQQGDCSPACRHGRAGAEELPHRQDMLQQKRQLYLPF